MSDPEQNKREAMIRSIMANKRCSRDKAERLYEKLTNDLAHMLREAVKEKLKQR